MHIIHTIAELRQALAGAAPHRLRADDGQPARGPSVARAAGQGARAARSWPASSSTGCSSRRTKTSTPIRARSERDCELLRERRLRRRVRARRERAVPASRRATRCSRPPSWPTSSKGTSGPGFFTGVCTVVLKLFNCVQPRVGGVRQEGLPAADGRARHGAAVRAADRDRRRRDGARRRRPGAVVAQRLPERATSAPRPCALSRELQAHRGGRCDAGGATGRRSEAVGDAGAAARAAGSPTMWRSVAEATSARRAQAMRWSCWRGAARNDSAHRQRRGVSDRCMKARAFTKSGPKC